MRLRHDAAFTRGESLVCLFVIAVLLILLLPHDHSALAKAQMMQTLSNMKQLHMATQSMEQDGVMTEDKRLGWPGDTGGTFTNWSRQLVPAYLSTNDFCKLMSASGKMVPAGKIPNAMSNCGVLVYSVSSNSQMDAVFLTTANFTNGPHGGTPLGAKAKPYGEKGFVVFRKNGEGNILRKNDVTNTSSIGSYVPLLQ